MNLLDALAEDLGVSGRTLRRAAGRGLIKLERPSPRKVGMQAREERYLRAHWPILEGIQSVLRTQPNVRMAVLFGSMARGEERAESDLDLLVSLADDRAVRRADIAALLRDALGRSVQVVSLRDASGSPALLADVLRDGRVLVDRDGEWQGLKSEEQRIRRRADREELDLNERAWETLETLER
jgi:predicted nucleotidyltransferase